MGYKCSKAFGPTDSAAGTKTAIGSTYKVPPKKGGHIHKLYVAKGNVVNAKENAGVVIVEVSGQDGTFEYAYGNGVGGNASSGVNPREEIDCRIPVPDGSTITVSITDAENATAAIVSADIWDGVARIDSYSAGGAGVDPAAATLKAVGTIEPTKAGRIKQIRYACGNVVNAKSSSGKLEILVPGLAGPYEYAVGLGASAATIGNTAPADKFDVDIPVTLNSTVTVNVTYTDATVSATVSLAIA